MRIGVISDIHAEAENLQLALQRLDAAAVDTIICAGDLIDGGTQCDDVVRLIFEREIPSVRGNHDAKAFNEQAWLRRVMKEYGETENPYFLESETVARVSQLPLTLRFNWEGVSVLMAHGTPWSNTEYVFPEIPVENAMDVVEAAEADICIFGHTHIPMRLRYQNAWLLNPGSLRRNRTEDRRTYGILTLPEVQFDVYDLETGEPLSVSTIVLDEQL